MLRILFMGFREGCERQAQREIICMVDRILCSTVSYLPFHTNYFYCLSIFIFLFLTETPNIVAIYLAHMLLILDYTLRQCSVMVKILRQCSVMVKNLRQCSVMVKILRQCSVMVKILRQCSVMVKNLRQCSVIDYGLHPTTVLGYR